MYCAFSFCDFAYDGDVLWRASEGHDVYVAVDAVEMLSVCV